MAKYTVTVRDHRPRPLNIIKINYSIEKTLTATYFRVTDGQPVFGSPLGVTVESINNLPIPEEIKVTHHGEVIGFLVRDSAQLDEFELNII